MHRNHFGSLVLRINTHTVHTGYQNNGTVIKPPQVLHFHSVEEKTLIHYGAMMIKRGAWMKNKKPKFVLQKKTNKRVKNKIGSVRFRHSLSDLRKFIWGTGEAKSWCRERVSEDADSFSQAVSRARWTVSCWHGDAGTCRNEGRFSVSDCWKAGQRGEGWEVTLVGWRACGAEGGVLLCCWLRVVVLFCWVRQNLAALTRSPCLNLCNPSIPPYSALQLQKQTRVWEVTADADVPSSHGSIRLKGSLKTVRMEGIYMM